MRLREVYWGERREHHGTDEGGRAAQREKLNCDAASAGPMGQSGARMLPVEASGPAFGSINTRFSPATTLLWEQKVSPNRITVGIKHT